MKHCVIENICFIQYYNLQKVEHVAGFRFEHRGPVTNAELEEAAAKDVKDQIAKLPAKVSGLRIYFCKWET